MRSPDLDASHVRPTPSMIGGAAQGGSAKPVEEREKMDRQNEQRQEDNPTGAGGSPREGTVGGNSSDSRTDQERSGDTGQA